MTPLSQILAFCDEVERLDKEATPKPWIAAFEVDAGHTVGYDVASFVDGPLVCSLQDTNLERNQNFIAQSRTRLPQAVKALREAVAALDEIKDVYDGSEASRCMKALTRIAEVLNGS